MQRDYGRNRTLSCFLWNSWNELVLMVKNVLLCLVSPNVTRGKMPSVQMKTQINRRQRKTFSANSLLENTFWNVFY